MTSAKEVKKQGTKRRKAGGKQDLLRRLPKVDDILKSSAVVAMLKKYPRRIVVDAVRSVVDGARLEILHSSQADEVTGFVEERSLIRKINETVLEVMRPKLHRVVNATGIVVHTNLGRSILPQAAIEALTETARAYSNVEFDIKAGKRGSRHDLVEGLICLLTGAEAAMVVNNNAAAVLLALSAMARRKEVIISRGQLVEIGGSFRIPDVMKQSGAKLVEVGTTNKTHDDDYRLAITEKTGLIMRAHPSNYQVVGFTAEVPLGDIVKIASAAGLPVLDDLGSGVMVDLTMFGLPAEPTVEESVAAGADVTTFSGDKLLGGPQAGIAVGKKKCIDKMKKHPLARAVRIDKLSLAALEATLKIYLDDEAAKREIPTLALLSKTQDELMTRAMRLGKQLNGASRAVTATAERGVSKAGGGALPLAELPTAVIALKPTDMSVNEMEKALRRNRPHIVGRIKDGRLLLDMRTITPEDEADIVTAVTSVHRLK